MALEGLSPNFAAYGLDPAFVESLDELQGRTDGPINEIYNRMERGWVNTMSYEKFIGRVRDAKMGIDTQEGVPEVLSTGWDHPSGHAISFVLTTNQTDIISTHVILVMLKTLTVVSSNTKSQTLTASLGSLRHQAAMRITPALSMLGSPNALASTGFPKKTSFQHPSISHPKKLATAQSPQERLLFSP